MVGEKTLNSNYYTEVGSNELHLLRYIYLSKYSG